MRYSLTSRRARARRSAPRGGFSLIEVIVAMTLLALGLSTMVALCGGLAIKARTNMYSGLRNAVLSQQVDRLSALPYSQLPTSNTSSTVTSGNFSYTVAVAVSTPVSGTPRTEYTVTVTPTNMTSLARSVKIERAKRAGCTLNTTNGSC
jgi:prepilin-type N-terminal cleavage/methylation domain-containing protein